MHLQSYFMRADGQILEKKTEQISIFVILCSFLSIS